MESVSILLLADCDIPTTSVWRRGIRGVQRRRGRHLSKPLSTHFHKGHQRMVRTVTSFYSECVKSCDILKCKVTNVNVCLVLLAGCCMKSQASRAGPLLWRRGQQRQQMSGRRQSPMVKWGLTACHSQPHPWLLAPLGLH